MKALRPRPERLTVTAALIASHIFVTAALGQPPRLGPAEPSSSSAAQLLERAIFAEDTLGDLDAAIAIYREMLDRDQADRAFVARASYRLAVCYVKKGETEAAIAVLEQLVADFPESRDLVSRAREQLATLGVGEAPADVSARRLWAPESPVTPGSISADGRLVTSRYGGELVVYDLSTGKIRQLTSRREIAETWGATHSKLSPDGRRIAYTWLIRQFAELRLIGVDGSGDRILLDGPMTNLRPAAWMPNGDRILASWRSESDATVIALVDAASGSVEILETLGSGAPLSVSISPDGRFIAYDLQVSTDSGQRDLFLLPIEGGARRPLVSHPASDFHPQWTPDGRSILFVTDRGGSSGLWLVDVAEDGPRSKPIPVRLDTGPIVPLGFTDSGSLHYAVELPGSDIYLASLDQETDTLVLPSAPSIDHFVRRNSSPSFSPDGERLSYYSRRGAEHHGGNPWTLVIRTLDGGAEDEISLSMQQFDPPLPPSWRPDGSSVVATTYFDHLGRAGFYDVDVRTGRVAPLFLMPFAASPGELVWSPDAKTVYFDRHLPGQGARCVLVARNLPTGTEVELARATAPWGINYVSLSPDGRTLAYPSTEDTPRSEPSQSVIYLVPTAGGERLEAFRAREQEWVIGGSGVLWTPDGNHLIFATGHKERPGQREIWKLAVRGGTPVRLAVVSEGLGHIALNPDGQTLALALGSSRTELWVLENFLPLDRP